MRIAIIGAGPIGLEAAAAATQAGHDVIVYEAGRVGEAVRSWGHVQLFTPWRMAVTEAGCAVAGVQLPDPEGYPTGAQLVTDYLQPLAAALQVRCGHRVTHVGRTRRRKGDALGSVQRTDEPFALLVEGPDGERIEHADAVFDCSGVFGDPAPAGPGGLPVPGEAQLARAGKVAYGPAFVGELGGRRVLLVGDGASATTVLHQLLQLAEVPTIHWLTPSSTTPGFASPDDDPLPARSALHALGRQAPSLPPVHHLPGRYLERLALEGDEVRAHLDDGTVLAVDQVVAATGFRPDHSLSRELQVHLCWGSEGPMKLAAALLSASGGGGGDCLAQPEQGADVLRVPEPRFFVLGNKSYGRRSDFLLQRGHAQVRDVLTLLES
jgi:cation diffusion facilitator CzcD-associated flavoprotein CzcO